MAAPFRINVLGANKKMHKKYIFTRGASKAWRINGFCANEASALPLDSRTERIMRLTTHTDYALRVLIYAAVEPQALCTVERISAAYDISRNHLMKVVNRLAEHGFVETVRGRGGGLALAMPANEIGIGDVVRRMEDDLAQAECFRPEQNVCAITPACGLRHALANALEAYLDTLDQFTLADITRKKAALARLLDLDGAA